MVIFFLYFYGFFFRTFRVNYDGFYLRSSYVYKNWVSLMDPVTDIGAVGYVLYTHYFLLFFICGLLLFLAMLGAIVLTLFRREGVKVQNLADQGLRSSEFSVYVRGFRR